MLVDAYMMCHATSSLNLDYEMEKRVTTFTSRRHD